MSWIISHAISAVKSETPQSGVYSQGVAPEFGVDHHSTYLRDWLTQAGVTEIDEIRFQPTLLTADPAESFRNACASAVELARAHGSL
jgi:FMN-dependent NADH-azoreductase